MDDTLDGGDPPGVTVSADSYAELGVAVTAAVAGAADRDALELPPLSEVGVDPEALEALFSPPADPSLEFTFRYADHAVSLYGDGTVHVVPADDGPTD